MTTEQALAIASLLIEFEIEQPQIQPPPPGWITDLRKARLTIQQLLTQANPNASQKNRFSPK